MSAIERQSVLRSTKVRGASRGDTAGRTTLGRRHLPHRSTPRRPGAMFVETAIGIALAVVVMIAVAQLVAVVAKQRRAMADLRQATQAAANAMERIMVVPWQQLTTEQAEALISPDASTVPLDDPQLSVTVNDHSDPLPAKQIEVSLSWRDSANRRVAPIRLVAWRYQAPRAE